jgi:hypothetical protein
MNIAASQAYFIKLGEGGRWEAECLKGGFMRVGFHDVSHETCAADDWEEVKKKYRSQGQKGGNATRYATELSRFYSPGDEHLWITFCNRKLWWGFSDGTAYQNGCLDKQRNIKDGWKCEDIKGNSLDVGTLSSRLTQVIGYRGTICDVKERDYLLRKINGDLLPEVQKAKTERENLLSALVPLIQLLTWRDFETLADMVFTAGGWRRLGICGKTEETIDLEMQQPVTGERVMVQVKAKSSHQIIKDISASFFGMKCDRIFVVTHSFQGSLPIPELDERLEIIDAAKLATLVLDAGFTDWLIEKSK